jgi:hypothetical protein
MVPGNQRRRVLGLPNWREEAIVGVGVGVGVGVIMTVFIVVFEFRTRDFVPYPSHSSGST